MGALATEVSVDPMTELRLMLRPAGGGLFAISTGRSELEAFQSRYYASGIRGATAAEVAERWERSLEAARTAEIIILGIPSDTGAGLVRGAAFGPRALRAALLDRNPTLSAWMTARRIVDVGDVVVVPQLLDDDMLSDTQKAATRAALYGGRAAASDIAGLPVSPLSIAERVLRLLLDVNPGAKPFVLGGDHSVAWPVVAALLSRPRSVPPAIVHLDAHTDLLADRMGVRNCFATWAYHANELLGRGGRLVQVGIRESGRPREHWEGTLGVRQIWAGEVAERGDVAVIDEVVRHVAALGTREVYLSNDIDGTDSGEAPSTGTPEPGGLSGAFVRALIQRLGREVSLIGADLVEVAPTVGDAEAIGRTLSLGASYVEETLRAMCGVKG